MSVNPETIDYQEVLRVLGYFIQQQHLSEVTLTEFERGWIVAGLTFHTTSQGFLRVPVDFIVSHDELRKLVLEMRDQRRDDRPKRGWLR